MTDQRMNIEDFSTLREISGKTYQEVGNELKASSQWKVLDVKRTVRNALDFSPRPESSPELSKKPSLDFAKLELPLSLVLQYQDSDPLEAVFSDMGSITLRWSDPNQKRRNASPIFYWSLRKTNTGQFVWTDIEGKEMTLTVSGLLEAWKSAYEFAVTVSRDS